MTKAHINNVIPFPQQSSFSSAEAILMNASLLKIFAEIRDDITHQVALEILQSAAQPEAQHIAHKLGFSDFCVRRALLSLARLGLLNHSDHHYQLAISLK